MANGTRFVAQTERDIDREVEGVDSCIG